MVRNRLDAARARTDTRDWARARRDRTRHLIELGGLVQKAGLVELLDDDRATMLGALLALAAELCGENAPELLAQWRRYGLRVLAQEREAADATHGSDGAESPVRTGTRVSTFLLLARCTGVPLVSKLFVLA